MYPTIRNSQRSVAVSPHRIEFIPSRRAGAIWVTWLLMSGALVLLSGLPGLCRIFLAVLVLVAGGVTLRPLVFLRGARALRALEWPSGEGVYHAWLGAAGGRRLSAIPEGCRQYGVNWWLLRFRTAEGVAQLLVDVRLQDAQAMRRLGRRLFRQSGTGDRAAAAAGRRGTDTIRGKV